MAAKPIEYPKILTNADWQKNKGLVAKGAGETGIGVQMNKTEALFKKFDWKAFNAKIICQRANGVFTPGHVDIKIKESVALYTKAVAPVRVEVQKLEKLASDTAVEWKKSKLIPSSSTKHVTNVATAADHLFIALKPTSVFIQDLVKDFEEEKTRLQRNVDLAKKGLVANFPDLEKYGKLVIANPTVAEYIGEATKGFHQKIRGTAAALKALSDYEEYKKLEPTWKTFGADGYRPKKDSEVTPKVKEVLKALQVLKNIKV